MTTVPGGVEFVSAVLLDTADLNRAVAFYRDVLGIPLVRAEHHDEGSHFECELGDTHFAIFEKSEASRRSVEQRVRIAFSVPSLEQLLERLESAGASPPSAIENRGFARLATVRDPDGNVVDLTELSESWLNHLRELRSKRNDAVDQVAQRNVADPSDKK